MIRQADQFVASLPPYPTGRYSGRGIVVCGGGPYFVGGYANVRLIRHLGCDWPIEWFYLPGEMDAEQRDILAPWGVRCVERPWPPQRTYKKHLGGWQLKSWAVLHSSFEEVLLVDSDSYLEREPSYLFDGPEWRDHAAIFWPDRFDLRSDAGCWMPPGAPGAWEAFGVEDSGDRRQMESGQLLVNKARSWQAMNLCAWYNDHWQHYYNFVYGDKDTFRMAWSRTGAPFFLVPGYCGLDPGVYVQRWTDGSVAFRHLIGGKWNISGRPLIGRHFTHRQLCSRFVADLRAAWSGGEGVSGYDWRNA
mgnify:CR=1 FL=1